MTWTTDEWEGFSLCLERWWKDPFDDSDRTAWKLAIDGLDPQLAVDTLKVMLRRGATWRPSVAEFVSALEPPAITFDEAWPMILAAMRSARWTCEAGGPVFDDSQTLQRILETAGRDAAGWVAAYGIHRLRGEDTSGDYAGATMHRLREHYADLVSRPDARDRLAAALESPRGLGRGVGGLRRVDPLAALGIGDGA